MALCEHCRDNLLEHLYGLLDGEEAREFERHLAECEACRSALETAKRDQALLSQAAHAVRDVAPFEMPGSAAVAEVVAAATAAVQTETPTTLPLTQPPRRSALRRYWPAWTAAAALFGVAIGGQHFYQQGLAERSTSVARAKKDVETIEARFASLQKTFAGESLNLEKVLRDERVHVHAMGLTQYHPAIPGLCRVTTRDVEGKPAKTDVTLRIVAADNKVVFEKKAKCDGEVALAIPAGLDLNASPERERRESAPSKLILETTNGAVTERMEEPLTLAPITFSTHISLNKRSFNVGELMFFRTLTLDRVSHQPPKESIPLRFSLLSEEGKEVGGLVGRTGPGGIAVGNFAVTDDLKNGLYTLQVQPDGEAAATVLPQTQVVEILREEGMEFAFDQANYKAGETVTATARPRLQTRFNRRLQDGQAGDKAEEKQNFYGLRISVDGKPVPALNAGAYSADLSQKIGADALGNAIVNFKLPAKIERGDVLMELERKSGKATERFVQAVPVVPSAVTVDFFPEGGELVPGVKNKMYYRLRTSTGEPVDADKVVINAGGEPVHQSTAKGGMGFFNLVPKGKQKYEAQLNGVAGSKATTEVRDPFRDLNFVTDGVALHVPQPVAQAGQPVEYVLRNPGPSRRLLLIATCRGVVFDQQVVSIKKGDNAGKIALPDGVDGLLRITVLHLPGEEWDGLKAAQPLAERLIFRTPIERLLVTCDTGKGPYLPGQKMTMDVGVRDEKNRASSAWALASVVDERVASPYSETDLPAFFQMLSSPRGGDDLDLAFLHLDATRKDAATALDLFLGIHGWRRFTPGLGAELLAMREDDATKDGAKAAAKGAVPLPIFSRENRPALAQRTAYQTARVQKLAEQEKRVGLERSTLIDERDRALLTAKAALEDFQDYQIRPALYFRAALGFLLFLFIAAGAVCLLLALYRYARAQSIRPMVGMSFVCLGLALALLIGGRSWLPSEISVESGGERFALNRKHWPELRILDVEEKSRFTRPVDLALLGRFGVKAPVAQHAQAKSELESMGLMGPDALARGLAREATGFAEESKKADRQRSQTGMDKSTQKKLEQAERFEPVPLEALFQNGELQDRFHMASKAQRAVVDGGKADKDGKKKGEAKTLISNILPTPTYSLGDGSTTAAKESSPSADEKAKGASLSLLVREYSYRTFPLRPYYQDTVAWHPTLLIEKGNAKISFDLSPEVPAYRILLLANSPTGRLGMLEQRLTVQPDR